METNPLNHITSKFIPPVLLSDIPENVISNLKINYIGSKTPTLPYTINIEIINTMKDYQDVIVFNTAIKSEYTLLKMATIEEMYNVHLEVIERLTKAINVNSQHSYLKAYNVPIPTLNTVMDLMKEAKLFDRLITGLMLN
jgi:hypothetical protein